MSVVNEGGGATVAEQNAEARDDMQAKGHAHPLVQGRL